MHIWAALRGTSHQGNACIPLFDYGKVAREEFLSPIDISEPSNGPDEWSTYVEENPVEPDGVTQDTNTTEHGCDWREADMALMSEIPSGPTESMVEGCVFDTDKELVEFVSYP